MPQWKQNFEDYEKDIINQKVWVTFDEAIKLYENMNKDKLEILVRNRELPIIKIAKDILKGVNHE